MKVKLVFPNGSENELGTLEAEIIEKSKKQAANSGLPIAGIVSKAVFSPFPIPIPIPGPGRCWRSSKQKPSATYALY